MARQSMYNPVLVERNLCRRTTLTVSGFPTNDTTDNEMFIAKDIKLFLLISAAGSWLIDLFVMLVNCVKFEI